MGKLDLLNSAYTGSVGETTGAKWKGQHVVKGKIWSKTPPSITQTKSVRAFEALNRVGSAISAKWFYWLGIKAATMHKHNAVARLLKDTVSEHEFTPQAMLNVFHENGTADVETLNVDFSTGKIDIVAKTTLNPATDRNSSWGVFVFTQQGTVLYTNTPETSSITASFLAPISEQDTVYCLVTTSQKQNQKYTLGGTLKGKSLNVHLVTFAAADPKITVDDTKYTFNIEASEALPSGSWEVNILSHAIQQLGYNDEDLIATMETDGTTSVKISFVPPKDALDQNNVYDVQAYIALEAGSIAVDENVYQFARTNFAAYQAFDVIYKLVAQPTVTAIANGYAYNFGQSVPDMWDVTIGDAVLETVNQNLQIEYIDNLTSSLSWNADHSQRIENWGTSIVWAGSQSGGNLADVSFINSSSPHGNVIILQSELLTFPPHTNRITYGSLDGTFKFDYVTSNRVGYTSSVIDNAVSWKIKAATTSYEPTGNNPVAHNIINHTPQDITLQNYTFSASQEAAHGFLIPDPFASGQILDLQSMTAQQDGMVVFGIQEVQNGQPGELIGIELAFPYSANIQ